MLLLEGEVGMLHMENSDYTLRSVRDRKDQEKNEKGKERLLRGDWSHQALEVTE